MDEKINAIIDQTIQDLKALVRAFEITRDTDLLRWLQSEVAKRRGEIEAVSHN